MHQKIRNFNTINNVSILGESIGSISSSKKNKLNSAMDVVVVFLRVIVISEK